MTIVISTTRVAPKLRDSSLRNEEWNNIVEGKTKIMDFQLKTLGLAEAASEKADALIVLLSPSAGGRAGGAAGELIEAARKAGDLPDKAGKCLVLYRPQGIAAARVVLAGLGAGPAAAAARSAV
ncbi:MAG: M17 family peptidase N-terminal domain-containing protein, partial [Xenophilus sp.]